VRYACIDIGSNTTRLLVAEPVDGRLREVFQQRTFTRLGQGLRPRDPIPEGKLADVARVVGVQARLAREVGAGEVRAVATAAIRLAANGGRLADLVRDATEVQVTILTEGEEARLAFLGATRTLRRRVDGEVVVADVGGGSTEIAVGTVAGGMRCSASFAVGSGMLADAYLRSDPPAGDELDAAREHVRGVFDGLEVRPPELAVAVGGSAASLPRLAGVELDDLALERGMGILASTTVGEVARRFELDPQRVRLLPAGILILGGISQRLRRPLHVGNGGLREGVILERVAQAR
jgi:exopolyphosphatase / guanosine-5'-triphosphate,3'-diphosphate pyrophosphatase